MNSEHRFADESLLRQYLLGELREPLRSKVEERLFTEPEYCEQLSVVEEDLIDSYVRGGLPAGEHSHFESHFLASPRRRERLEFARTWVATAADGAATPEPGFRPFLFLRSPWLLPSVCGASLILLVALGASVIRLNWEFAQEHNDRLAAEMALLRAGAASREAAPNPVGATQRAPESQIASAEASRPPAPLATFLLRPGVERSIGAAGKRLVIPRGTYPIQLELEQTARKSYPSYEVRIEDFEGNEIWSKAQIQPGRGVSSNLIRVTLPSAVLRPGDYRVSISGVTADGSVEELAEYYAFQAIGR